MKPPSPSHQNTLLNEPNTQRYTITKTDRITFSHPHGTHDDRSWALAAYATEKAQPPPSIPIAHTT